ncbi:MULTISPECIES: cytochrome P450 [Calothrix]|uniref:Cytochrome P450 n=2 Tax=Calothrix TaxID=1186 RepID=A0ABR8AAH4_9CYAN|nr:MULTISPECIES: cytochrome P450 [Calothrix]MBD2196440.1 cytochrome P450 [Calothrix parietina FACHB-288]MBD2224665.1 cytochrome P450 [Calothrix anomala FACHB-343]
METKDKILKGHKRQIRLSRWLAKVGYNSPIGKFLRLIMYYQDGFILLKAWRDFLNIRRENIGDKFFAVDHAIIHASHTLVRDLMHVEPQLRGNDLGIIRIYASSYMLNNPLSLGMNGNEHTGVRAVFLQALPNPYSQAELLGQLVDQSLAKAADRRQLHVGNDLPKMMLEILHQLVFQISLSEEELAGSGAYIKGLVLSSLPTFVSKYLLFSKTGPNIRHRQRLIERYKQSPKWASYMQIAAQYRLNEHQIANSLFDMIHIAGTAGTSALLGSVIGVLCLDDNLKNDVLAEINTVWNGQNTPNGSALEQSTLTNRIVLETSRLYPPVRFVSQLTTNKGTVEIGGQQCPFQKGTRLLGSIFNANRDPQRYQNPNDFDVTRDFSDILSWNGEGHERVCPGKSLSIGIIQMFCFYLLKKYQWNSITEVKWDFEKVTAVTPNNLILQGFTHQQ